MEYINAAKEHAEKITDLVQNTIKTIYPKYYPKEVVEFFCKLHCTENIEEDIKKGYLRILLDGNCIFGTGSYVNNHITRVYVHPNFQGKGYGSFIIEKLEKEIALTYNTVCLDASLPASRLYEKLGYKTVKHEKYLVENDAVLVYEIMEKKLL